MKQRQRIAFSFTVAIIVLFFAVPGFSQWTNVLTCRSNGNGIAVGGDCGFFFNEFLGWVGSADDGGIYQTTDGGASWVHQSLPVGYSGRITQIFMSDHLHGWLTVEQPGNIDALFKTSDGGTNWIAAGPKGNYSCVTETPSTLVVTSRSATNTGTISPDGGVTFQMGMLSLKNGVDFVDDLHGVATGFHATPWQKTVDGGRTWADITPQQTTETWSVYGVKGTSVFYTAGETDQLLQVAKGTSKVMRSVDYGSTWTQLSTTKFYTTGHIAGVGENALYVQAENDKTVNDSSGMFRSTDRGLTWKNIGGPSNFGDTRFVVTGCNGGIVYAFDANGIVWKTRNGGDGQINEPPVKAQIYGDPIVFAGPICTTSDAALRIENLYCNDDTILSAQVLDTTSDLFKSGALNITVMPSFPLFLGPNTSDSIRFTWQPFKIFHTDTTVTIKVRVKYYSKILGLTFDTTVTVSVHAVGVAPQASIIPADLNFGNISLCAQPDTSFIIRNLGCDTLYVLNAIGTAPLHYQILDSNGNPLQLPVLIAPADSDKIIIRLTLDSAGNYSSDLHLTLRHQGILKDTLIHIAGVISANGSFVVADSIDFGTVSTCRTADSLIQIKNLSCNVPITITSALLSGNTVFSLIGSPPYTSQIAPDSTGSVNLKFSPNKQQNEIDTLTLIFYSLGEKQIKKIIIRGSGVLNIPKFVTSLVSDTLFDLAMTRCDSPRIYPVILSNPGCKNITVKSVQLQGIITPDISLSLGSPLPKNISASSNTNLQVTVKPIDLGVFNGLLHITYQIEGDSAIHDTLIAYYLTVSHGTRILSLDHDSIYLGTFKLCDARDSVVTIKNRGCDLLDILQIQVQGQGHFVLTPPAFSSPLSQNQSERIPFHFDPTQAGFITGTLTITSVSDTLPVRTVTITANIIPTDTLTFSMLPTRNIFYAGDTLSVSLIPQQNVHGKGLQNVAFTVNYNSDLMAPLPPPNAISSIFSYLATTPSGTPKHTTMRIFLQGNPTLEMDSLVPIMTFRFSTYLTDSITTRFDLTDIQLNGGDSLYAKCDLGILSASLTYQLSLQCGDSTLIKFLQLGKNLKIFAEAVYPNPLTEQNNFQAAIPFQTSGGGLFAVKIFDQLGRMVNSKQLRTEFGGSHQFTIDGRNLSAGCYTYLLQEISNSSASIRGRFIITR